MSTSSYAHPTGAATSPNPTTGDWTIAGSSPAATAWQSVAKAVGVSFSEYDVTYLKRLNSSGVHYFDIGAFSPTIDDDASIVAVYLWQAIQRTSAGACNSATRILVDGSQTTGGNEAASTSWQLLSTSLNNKFPDNPATIVAWLVGQIKRTTGIYELTGIGVNATAMASGEEIRCAHLYAECVWNPAPAPGTGAQARAYYLLSDT